MCCILRLLPYCFWVASSFKQTLQFSQWTTLQIFVLFHSIFNARDKLIWPELWSAYRRRALKELRLIWKLGTFSLKVTVHNIIFLCTKEDSKCQVRLRYFNLETCTVLTHQQIPLLLVKSALSCWMYPTGCIQQLKLLFLT